MDLVTALLYSRVSSEDQARLGMSLDVQLDELQHYVLRQQWTFGGQYTDVMTGKRDDRPEYQRMLADIRALRSQGQRVVVVALDRFDRRLGERIRCRDELRSLGVAVHSVREGGEVSDLVANILGAVAQEEVRRLGERVHANRAFLQDHGWYMPGKAPWGYRWRRATPEERANGAHQSVLMVDEDAAPYVNEMFRRAADGQSGHAIARWIATLPASARGARKTIDHKAVLDALRAVMYVARPPARWPPIVDADTFAAVQAHLDSWPAQQATGRYLLTGFFCCPKCDGPVYGRYVNERHARYYACNGCRNWIASAQPLERDTLAAVTATLHPLYTWDAAAFEAALRASQQPDELTAYRASRVAKFRRDAADARETLTRAATMYVNREIDREGYEAARDQAQATLLAADAELEALEAAPRQTVQSAERMRDAVRHLEEWLSYGTIAHQRMALAELVRGIVPERIGRARFRITVTWTETGAALCALARYAVARVG